LFLVIQICINQKQNKNHLHKRVVIPDEVKMVIRHENTAGAVIGIANWI
jgi:hypothetical protein